jgi:hypothetical protein
LAERRDCSSSSSSSCHALPEAPLLAILDSHWQCGIEACAAEGGRYRDEL